MEIGLLLLSSFIFIPFIIGVISFTTGKNAKYLALLGSIATLVIAACIMPQFKDAHAISLTTNWLPTIGATFSLSLTNVSAVLVLLTSIVFTITFIAIQSYSIDKSNRFYGLMMLSQAGLMGVFLANDLLLFYFFWELALIPIYFLCSTWGGERRIKTTYKFFVYTFLGSLIMLSGIIWLYTQTPTRSFDYESIMQTGKSLPASMQSLLFCFFFVAFAIKMPIFPFHTWQPDTYEQAYTPITIVLSAVMVKMGLFATYKWLLPVFPESAAYWSNTIMILAIINIIYGSLLAMTQTNIKRIVAYSSIAHVGLMCLGLFANTPEATNGWLIQMFNHGINITGMWLVMMMIENRYHTLDLRELGGMGNTAPRIVIAFVIIAFANIGLPLTNGFIGEFSLFMGVFQSANPYHITYMVLAGLGIILGAIYTLHLVQKTAYGEIKNGAIVKEANTTEWLSLLLVIVIIIAIGVYPKLLFGFGSLM